MPDHIADQFAAIAARAKQIRSEEDAAWGINSTPVIVGQKIAPKPLGKHHLGGEIWVAWGGGENPVGDVRVDVICLNGERYDNYSAIHLKDNWEHCCPPGFEILEYQVRS